jgi:hypothetical protein
LCRSWEVRRPEKVGRGKTVRLNGIASEGKWWEIPIVSATVDSSKRVRIRQAKPGEEYQVEPIPSGFMLTRLVKLKPEGNYRLSRKNGYLMIETDREITAEEVNKALADFP